MEALEPMPNNYLPVGSGEDLKWKQEVDRLLEQVVLPALKRIEELMKAGK